MIRGIINQELRIKTIKKMFCKMTLIATEKVPAELDSPPWAGIRVRASEDR
jgi:hypothetical protein